MATRIILPNPLPRFASESSVKEGDSILRDMAALTAKEAEHASQSARLKQSVDWTPEKEQLAQSLTQQGLSHAQEWLAITERVNSLLTTIAKVDKPAARQEAWDDLVSAQTKVRGDLVSIGFAAPMGDTPATHRDCIDDAMIWKHPAVRAASAKHDSIAAYDPRDIINHNEAEIAKLRSRIGAAIAAATSRLPGAAVTPEPEPTADAAWPFADEEPIASTVAASAPVADEPEPAGDDEWPFADEEVSV